MPLCHEMCLLIWQKSMCCGMESLCSGEGQCDVRRICALGRLSALGLVSGALEESLYYGEVCVPSEECMFCDKSLFVVGNICVL